MDRTRIPVPFVLKPELPSNSCLCRVPYWSKEDPTGRLCAAYPQHTKVFMRHGVAKYKKLWPCNFSCNRTTQIGWLCTPLSINIPMSYSAQKNILHSTYTITISDIQLGMLESSC